MKKHVIFFLVFVCLSFQFCKKEKQDEPSGSSYQATGLTRYPFRIGNEWEYEDKLTLVFSDSSIISIEHTKHRIDSMFILNGIDSVFNVSGCDSVFNNGDLFFSNNFYHQTDSGVYNIGYQGVSSRAFLRQQNHSFSRILFNHNLYSIAEFRLFIHQYASTDTLILENTPLPTLKFPVVNNEVWEYRHSNNPFGIYKEYNGMANVTTGTGVFSCQVVKITWDLQGNGTIDTTLNEKQYISPTKGLVKTLFSVSDIVFTDSDGNPVDTATWIEECTLSRINF